MIKLRIGDDSINIFSVIKKCEYSFLFASIPSIHPPRPPRLSPHHRAQKHKHPDKGDEKGFKVAIHISTSAFKKKKQKKEQTSLSL